MHLSINLICYRVLAPSILLGLRGHLQSELDAREAHPDGRRAQIQTLRAEFRRLTGLVDVIGEDGDDVEAVVSALAETEEQRDHTVTPRETPDGIVFELTKAGQKGQVWP